MVSVIVSFRIKPSTVWTFTKQLEQEAHPLIRSEKGFQGHFAFFDPAELKAFSVSLWDDGAAANFEKITYLQVLALAGVMEGRATTKVYGEVRPAPDSPGALQAALTLLGKGESVGIVELSTATFRELNVPSLL